MNSLLYPSNTLPLTPNSSRKLSSSIKQKVRPAPYHLRTESPSQSQFPKTRPNVIKTQHSSPLYSLPSPSHQPPFLRSQEFTLHRTSSLPAYSHPPTSLPTASSAPQLEIPYFGQSSSKSESSPLVFSPNYISTFLNKFDDDSQQASSSSSSRCHEQHQLLTPHPVCEGRVGLQRCQSESLGRRSHLPRPIIIAQPPAGQYSISVTPTTGSHPIPAPATILEHHEVFASARTTLVGTGSAYGNAVHALEDEKDLSMGYNGKSHVLRLLEEKHKQKYAIELIEQALATVNRIWPETIETSSPLPLERKPVLVVTTSTPISPITPSFAHLRSQVLQQATPDSSPATTSKKRKRNSPPASDLRMDAEFQSNKRRAGFQLGAENLPMAVPIPSEPTEPTSEAKSSTTPSSSSPITLRLFVRELLRRSKTHCSTLEVALCYLDGVEETVKRLKDCYKLGMAFGTVAMAEKGVYEEGMKDEKRIMSLAEVAAESAEMMGYLDHQEDSIVGWTPISPESDHDESKAILSTPKKTRDSGLPSSSPASSLNILASHPLLDPRRSFLAALVIATKFLQDRAYSNKAWAKLSGLPAQEIGRCERALGGALGWRVWVGKDFGKNTPHVSTSPVHRVGDAAEDVGAGGMEVGSTEEGTNGDDVVHGLNDPLADSFIAAAASAQAQATAKAANNSSAPPNVATASSTTTAAAAGVWSRAMSWPCFAPSTSTSASSSAPSSATWVSDEYLNLGEDSSLAHHLALSTSASASHFIEPTSLAASLQIINSMLDEAEAKQKSAPRFPSTEKAFMGVGSGSISVTPSTPETIIVPGDHHLPQPITAGKTPVMPMCGAFLHCSSPLQMETGVTPYPFSFVAPAPASRSSGQAQTLSPSPTLLHPGCIAQSLKLSPFGASTLGSGGSCRSGSSLDSTSFYSPDEIDTPPQHISHSRPHGQVKIAVDRQATLVDHHMEFSLDGLTSFAHLPSDSLVKPQRYLAQPLPHPLHDRRQYAKSANRLYESAPIAIPHIPPASVAF